MFIKNPVLLKNKHHRARVTLRKDIFPASLVAPVTFTVSFLNISTFEPSVIHVLGVSTLPHEIKTVKASKNINTNLIILHISLPYLTCTNEPTPIYPV